MSLLRCAIHPFSSQIVWLTLWIQIIKMCHFRVHLEKMVYQDIQARGGNQWVTFTLRNVVKFSKPRWLISEQKTPFRILLLISNFIWFFEGVSRQEWPSWPLRCCWSTSKRMSWLSVFILFQVLTVCVRWCLFYNVHFFRANLERQALREIEAIQAHQDLLVRTVYRELPVRRVPRWDFILISQSG